MKTVREVLKTAVKEEVKKFGPPKGTQLNIEGQPGELTTEPEGLVFGNKPTRTSPYDALLRALQEKTEEWLKDGKRTARPVILFGNSTPKSSIPVRARKLKIRVTMASGANDALYVRYEGKLDDALVAGRREKIKTILNSGQVLSHIQITNRLRDGGDVTIDAATTDAIMLQMMRSGDVVRQEGGSWKLLRVAR